MIVKADKPPPSHCYLAKGHRILIQSVSTSQAPSKARAPSKPPKKASGPPPSASVPAAPASLVDRVANLEQRFDTLEARSGQIEKQLQDGFSLILSRLDKPATQPRRSAESHTGATPPPKLPRNSSVPKVSAPEPPPLALANAN